VVGSPFHAYNVNNAGPKETYVGTAYIYTRNALGNWSFVKQLKASDAKDGGLFGRSVAISGDTILVGSRNEAVYIFQKDQGGTNNWGQVKKIVSSDDAQGDWFGYSVAVSNNTHSCWSL
jgi:hypothetical protein